MGRSTASQETAVKDGSPGFGAIMAITWDPNEFDNLAVNPDAGALAAMRALLPRLRSKASGATSTTPFNPNRW